MLSPVEQNLTYSTDINKGSSITMCRMHTLTHAIQTDRDGGQCGMGKYFGLTWVQPLGAATVEGPVLVGLTAGLLAVDDQTTHDPGKIFVM